MPSNFLDHLQRIGRKLVRWRAELNFTWGLSAIMGWVCVLGLVDLWLQLDRPNRIVTWSVLLALVAGTLWLVRKALHKSFTPEGVAATIEKAFPQLDNHLINYLQLARNPAGDPFREAYVRAGVPEWQGLDFQQMRDATAHKRSRITLGIVAFVLLVPLLIFGQAWGVALARTINPFANIEPASLTKIVKVAPGNTTVMQGGPAELSCTVKGFEGHEVRVEIEPSDAPKSTFSLGKLDRGTERIFSHQLSKVTTGFRYRFRAGDAPNSAWFTVATRPPPSFKGIDIVAAPPAYTKRPNHAVNPRDGRIVVPVGSELRIAATSSAPLESITLEGGGGEPVRFVKGSKPNVWIGKVTLGSGTSLRLKAEDDFGGKVSEDIAFTLEPDKVPGIEILAPGGRASLAPGQRPQIEFRVSDDYGIAEVIVEEVQPDDATDKRGTVAKAWKPASGATFHQFWKSETTPARSHDIAYRIVARDNRPGRANETVSSTILFTLPSQGDIAQQRNKLEQTAMATLQRLLELQKKNIADTESFRTAMKDTTEAQWSEAATRQDDIRKGMRELLASPLKPLGALTDSAQKLYANEMVLATDTLKAVPAAEASRKDAVAGDALTFEVKILRQLTFAMNAAGEAKIDRRVAGISAMIEALIRDQGAALEQTNTFAKSQAKVAKPLVELQDKVGEDMNAFLAACKDEAAQVVQNDAALADTLNKLSARAAELKIRNDMVIAAERLDQNKPADAVPLETRSLAGLRTLQGMLEQIKLKEEAEKRATLAEATKQAQEKLAKIEALHEKMLQAMETVRGQKNKDDKAVDEMEEEFKELVKNTKEALLEVPNDLHIFTDLNVANDLVEDVFSVFQEIEQKAGSEKDAADAVKELGYAKEDELLAQMGEAQKRLDAVEMWLQDKPDELKVTTEAHDKAEMPESGIALAELAAAAQDLVGDLMKEDEKMAKEADDSATNHAMPDFPSGWDVMEGDIASFGAQGKSGNQTPDHKEQDGRSNVGRQGMSNGETASSSGTIGEGDKNIEARRTEDPTQSGQVDLKGEADTKATGGGKLATGKADEAGMSGGAERIDSKEAGSAAGMAALMAKKADAIYAKASMKNVRVAALKDASHAIRQSADAIAKGNIEQVREFRKVAAGALNRAQAQLQAGPSGSMSAKGTAGPLDNVIESGPDMAPPQYRDKVAEYYKALNGSF